ncbi:MAG: hypothetical protein R2940_07505 [Syntrophotaleaceae bacterium]
MEDHLTRMLEDLVGRFHGPLTFRFILQPIMAILFAIRDGYKDAKSGKAPYFYALFTSPGHRREMLREGWKSVGKIFILAVILDLVYQYIVLPRFFPVEALLISTALALVPYLIVRGPVNRVVRRTVRS